MSFDLEKLSALFALLGEKDIAEFEHEEDGLRIRVVRPTAAPALLAGAGLPQGAHSAQPQAAHSVHPSGTPGAESAPMDGDFVDVTSPFVGSFFRSPSPDAPPFVEVGSVVRPGQTLCIIEAMKLMNEIEAECAGTVAEVFAQNGKSVEYGQKLFRIKKA